MGAFKYAAIGVGISIGGEYLAGQLAPKIPSVPPMALSAAIQLGALYLVFRYLGK